MGIAAVAIASLAVSAVAGYQQYRASREVAGAQQEGREIQSAQQQIQQRQQRRQSIREERVRRARIMQAAANTGVGGSSSQTGALGALGTMTGTNISNAQGGTLAARGMSQQNQRMASAQQSGQLWGTIGQISGTAFSDAGGFGAMGGLFGPRGQQQGAPVQGGFGNEIFTIQ